MKAIDHIYRIAVVLTILMLPASIILLGVSIYLRGTGFCISIPEAVGMLICAIGCWAIMIVNAMVAMSKKDMALPGAPETSGIGKIKKPHGKVNNDEHNRSK